MIDPTAVPLQGSTFIEGPSGAGKTRLTAGVLEEWLDRRGPAGVVVLDFGPELPGSGRVIGRRLDRYLEVPATVWYGHIDANGPRTEGANPEEMAALARANAERVSSLIEQAPDAPTAVFVNDVTIAAHHDLGVLEHVTDYADRARCAVVNGYTDGALEGDDDLSRRERAGVRFLRQWADRTVRLPP